MSLRQNKPADSLELLLDTMCNLFGGIVLLAVLVTLLAKQEKRPETDGSSDNREMLQKRITRAELELDSIRGELDELEAKIAANPANEIMRMVTERKHLLRQLEALREQLRSDQAQTNNGPSNDPAQRLAQLQAEKDALELQRSKLDNSLATIAEAQKQAAQRENDIRRQLSFISQKQTQLLRLPQERETTKDAFWILVKHGRLYPLWNSAGDRNVESISWREGRDSVLPTPIPDRGIDPSRSPSAFMRVIQNVPLTKYVAYVVWEDSFATFNAAKQITIAAKREYGWDPQKQSETVSFSATGSRPSAQ